MKNSLTSFKSPVNKSSQFTLIELLTCLSIIILLATVLIPALKKVKEGTKTLHCVNNLRQMGFAFSLYEGDHHNWPAPRPPSTYWFLSLWPYTEGSTRFWDAWADKDYLRDSIWTCPSFGDFHPTEWSMRGYGINIGLPPSDKVSSWPVRREACPEPQKIRNPSITVLAGDSRGIMSALPGDYGNWHLDSCRTYDIEKRFGYVHDSSAAMLFTDLHAEANEVDQYLDYYIETDFESIGSY